MIVEMLDKSEIETLKDIVDKIIDKIVPEDFEDEAINFGSLYCADVEGCYSYSAGVMTYIVYVEEASPEAVKLQRYVEREVAKRFYVPVFVKTEW